MTPVRLVRRSGVLCPSGCHPGAAAGNIRSGIADVDHPADDGIDTERDTAIVCLELENFLAFCSSSIFLSAGRSGRGPPV
jgi:hypothetical protein